MAQSLNSDSGLSTSHLISPTLPRPSAVVDATLALLFLMHLLDNRGRLCFLRFEVIQALKSGILVLTIPSPTLASIELIFVARRKSSQLRRAADCQNPGQDW